MNMATNPVEQLSSAAKAGDLETVKTLLREGVDPNVIWESEDGP
jgi:hypothetical protein